MHLYNCRRCGKNIGEVREGRLVVAERRFPERKILVECPNCGKQHTFVAEREQQQPMRPVAV